jgi:glycosyltransferase involved in cell wall biosynthesis
MAKEARAIPDMVDNGYISDKSQLAEVYQSVDIVWTPADTTYLSRPGIEALASGIPVVVPDVVPYLGADSTTRIPRSLVQPGCGWIVDGDDDTEVKDLLRSLNSTPPSVETHERCRRYAESHHSVSNIDEITSRLA